MISLFGDSIEDQPIRQRRDKAHAAPIGSGPAGTTCKTCRHYCLAAGGARNYRKCLLMKPFWTHGPGSDIRAKDPSCRKYIPEEKP